MITIVGCGNVGSLLAFWFAIGPQPIKVLNLIDIDNLSNNNLPYVFSINKNRVGLPKVFLLEDILNSKIQKNITINSYHDNYKNVIVDDTFIKDGGILIDCMDTVFIDEMFFVKLLLDINSGLLLFNPVKNNDFLYHSDYLQKPDIVMSSSFTLFSYYKIIQKTKSENRNKEDTTVWSI